MRNYWNTDYFFWSILVYNDIVGLVKQVPSRVSFDRNINDERLYRLLKAVLDNIYTTCENLMPVLEIWVFRTFEIRFSVMTKIHGKNATF